MIALLAALTPFLPAAPGSAFLPLPAAARPQDAAPAQERPAAPSGPVPTIQEEGEYYVLNFAEDPADAMDLERFVKVCQTATGRNFLPTGDDLKNKKIRMFGPKRIPKGDFYAFFQIMMFIHDFACIEVGPPHLAVIVIQNIGAQARQPTSQNLVNKPIYVDSRDLGKYEDQPAVLIRTMLHLPNTDVRQLSNSLRTILPQGQAAGTESLINAGGTNAVILTGFGSNIAALAKLLQLVDEASKVDEGPEPVFDVIPLEFADPEEVADVIDQLLEARTKALQDAQRNRAVPAEGVPGGTPRVATESKILVDRRTSSLLVSAMPDDMPRIKDLVARLDVDVAEPERNYHIYSLQNVKAEELAEVLKDFLQDASRVTDAGGGTGGRPPGAAGGGGGGGGSSNNNEVVVVHDEATNALLIAASKSRYEEILDLIQQLDQRQDQVLIETALIELTGSHSRDIGVELGLADIPGTGEMGGFGVTSFGLSTFQDTDGNGIPDVKVPNQLSGITGGILDGDDFALPVLVRLIDERDDSNVLNIPSVLVNNNGHAEVITKDEQPTTTITAFGGGGVGGGQTQENFNGYQEAGVTLSISPSISASNYLRLGVTLVVSNFVGTFSGSIPPPRLTRQITTEVNVPDGDTMVIGGIVTDNLQESQDGVPFLSDIPLLGYLFSRKTNFNNRTTLYFFVTPHILQDRDFADLSELSYRRKLEAAETMGSERMKLVDPDYGNVDGDLSGFDIPLYKSPTRGEVDSAAVGIDPAKRSALLEAQTPPAGAPPASTPPPEPKQ